jgi:hypothetical protein
MSKKKNQPSMTSIKKTLMESAFNPRLPGPMMPIVEQNDPKYYSLRAKELITEATFSLGQGPTPNSHQLQQYHLKMIQAIGLLALARITTGGSNEAEGAPR